jgi:hypothetical protein
MSQAVWWSRARRTVLVTFFAHSENAIGIKHDLVEHLKSVAQLAGKFAEKFGAADFGCWVVFGTAYAGSRAISAPVVVGRDYY